MKLTKRKLSHVDLTSVQNCMTTGQKCKKKKEENTKMTIVKESIDNSYIESVQIDKCSRDK